MPEFQLLRCEIALGGDKDTTVYRHRGRPIMFPELEILQSLHGYDAITDIAVVGVCDMSQDEALERLRLLYGVEQVGKVYHGPRPRLPTADSTLPLCTRPVQPLKPTLPESPDPVLRPLEKYTLPQTLPPEPVTIEETEAGAPGPYDLAEHDQDAEADNADDLGLGLPDLVARPVVGDLPQSRVSFRGGVAAQARRTPDHLPDVMDIQERPRRPEENDHTRPRG